MCTVLLRLTPGGRWPVLLGAVRDEFVERAWDGPAAHWPGTHPGLLGGRDSKGGGTWLALDPAGRAVAALLNAGRREEPEDGEPRPTRGTLALRVLGEEGLPEDVRRYDLFHLLRADLRGAELWSWDGASLAHQVLEPGDHIIVNAGLDADDDPLVPHFTPLLHGLGDDLDAWRKLMAGDGLDPGDERALVVRKEIDGHPYGTTSASLIGLSEDEVRYEFTATPVDARSWFEVELGRR